MKHSIEECQTIAQSRGGKCLSASIRNINEKLLWQCGKCDFQWSATFKNVAQNRSWCPKCANPFRGLRKGRGVEFLHELANKFNGKCLASKYIKLSTKYEWECNCGHRWFAKANDVQQDHWCIKCANKRTGELHRDPNGLVRLHQLAKNNNGFCLSDYYQGIQSYYSWKCGKCNHTWEATVKCITRGCWCPKCSQHTSKAELQLLEFVQQYFPEAKKAKGVLPNKRFELDIYIPSLKKAIEYDGYHWHHSEWAQKHKIPKRDARKSQQCQEVGIQLLRVSETDYLTNPQQIQEQVATFLWI